MIKVTTATAPQTASLHAILRKACAHRRIVDEVRTKEGTKTGQLICLECLAVFPDPNVEEPVH